MKSKNLLIFSVLLSIGFLYAYRNNTSENTTTTVEVNGNTVATRFGVPNGFERTNEGTNSFGAFLRNLPLKKVGSLVKYYDGDNKDDAAYIAVVDLPIGNKDLHQCADAVMRLRAEYLYKQKQYDKIHFNFTNGFRVDYTKWAEGYRIAVKGNKTSWVKKAKPDYSAKEFWNYLEQIFLYAGTASLEKELKPVASVDAIQIGDVFIKGGFPGHAVIVVDVAQNKQGKKVMMLAQSYMPAQELQILKNPNNASKSPWYDVNFGETLITPEWTFKKSHLKRF
ncbi:DUF4846 domain-containing protein [Flavobacterium sp. GCM10023249]|uniref:DUF4846 domain-containing protein n=1 Tax=unclassified Flavobacterium TaxID=196869 RepID=UPI00360BC649